MGLDIYLYWYRDYEDAKRRGEEYEARSTRAWGCGGKKYEQMTEAEIESSRSACAAIASELGLQEWGTANESDARKIKENSKKYPEHLWKIGYFRSSYNEAGIHHILSERGLPSLEEIFGKYDEYCLRPDWHRVRSRALTIAKALAQGSPYRTTFIGPNIFGHEPIRSEREALVAVEEEIKRGSEFGSYSNKVGTFELKEPMQVVAIMPGIGHFEQPGCWCVYKPGDLIFYPQCMEILAETCDWVLAQPDPQNFYLHWSS